MDVSKILDNSVYDEWCTALNTIENHRLLHGIDGEKNSERYIRSVLRGVGITGIVTHEHVSRVGMEMEEAYFEMGPEAGDYGSNDGMNEWLTFEE